MLARRLRRRPNIEPTLVQCLVFARIAVGVNPAYNAEIFLYEPRRDQGVLLI